MNIVVFNHYAGSPKMGMEFRPYYLAKEWVKMGHNVIIVAASYSHLRVKNKEVSEKITEENIDGIKYIWIKTKTYEGNGIGRIVTMFQYTFSLYTLIDKYFNDKVDLVIAGSTYLFDNYPVYKLSRKCNAKYIHESRDLWPLTPMELGGFSRFHPFILMLQHAENYMCKHVDKLISVLPCSEKHFKEHGLRQNKFCYIPNGIDISGDYEPVELDLDIDKSCFNIGYCGGMAQSNSLELVLDVAKELKKDGLNVKFHLVGKGAEKDKLISIAKKNTIDNVFFYDAIPKNQIQSLLTFFDALIITWNDSPLYKYGISPNKLYDYLYSGKPVIQAVNAGNDILAEAKAGITCDTKVDSIKKAIIELMSKTDEERLKMGENGRKYVIENNTYENLAVKFLEFV